MNNHSDLDLSATKRSVAYNKTTSFSGKRPIMIQKRSVLPALIHDEQLERQCSLWYHLMKPNAEYFQAIGQNKISSLLLKPNSQLLK